LAWKDPKSTKKSANLSVIFVLLESGRVRAGRKTLVKLTPGVMVKKAGYESNNENNYRDRNHQQKQSNIINNNKDNNGNNNNNDNNFNNNNLRDLNPQAPQDSRQWKSMNSA